MLLTSDLAEPLALRPGSGGHGLQPRPRPDLQGTEAEVCLDTRVGPLADPVIEGICEYEITLLNINIFVSLSLTFPDEAERDARAVHEAVLDLAGGAEAGDGVGDPGGDAREEAARAAVHGVPAQLDQAEAAAGAGPGRGEGGAHQHGHGGQDQGHLGNSTSLLD